MEAKKRVISVSEIIKMLNDGMTRKEINKALELNPKEAKHVWSHKDLKNKKPAKYKVDILLVNDFQTEVKEVVSKEENSEDSPQNSNPNKLNVW